jgi:chromosome partitioning protein
VERDRIGMRNTITVMNAKGGVGKSTLVLALAETLAVHHRKKILVIDSDAHASVSNMLMPHDWLQAIQAQGRTAVDYLIAVVLKGAQVPWNVFATSGVSDVDDARTIDLFPGGGHLTLFEREVSKSGHETRLREAIRSLLDEVGQVYDLVLIDSAPGLSIVTECWLREADFYLSPTKPDYLSTQGLSFLSEFSQRDSAMGFAECLGIIISIKDEGAVMDEQFEGWLRRNAAVRCFDQVILRAGALQTAAHFCPRPRSYWAKYPGQSGKTMRQLALELLARLKEAQQQPHR